MQSEMPFYEEPEEALKDAVKALGGAKKVAWKVWPDKSEDAAYKHLLDCLNSGRPEKLEITQIMLLFRLAKEVGCYGPFAWFAGEIGYDCTPISKEDQKDRLLTVVEQSAKTLANVMERLERLQAGTKTQLRTVA